MSVLLVGFDRGLGVLLARRLVAQGDEVRVIEPGTDTTPWTEAGAHVARGSAADDDLVERAAQNVRTIIAFGDRLEAAPIVAGGARAGVGRIVWVTGALPGPAAVTSAGIDYVIVRTARRRLPRTGISPDDLAVALDAADDLAGHPRLALDLDDPSGWDALRLRDPRGR